MTIAYSYIRFSHPDQRRGNSLRRQLDRSHRFAAVRGLDLDDSIRDFARSAFHNRHTVTGNLGGFLALVGEGKIAPGSYLLIESFDRLSRDEFWPAFDLIRDIFRARINIVTLPDDDEEHEYSYDAINKNPTLINEIINDLTRSHRESKIKSARCGDACAAQRADARAGLAKVPGRCPAWLKPIRGTIVVDGREKNATIGFEERAELVEVVRLIFSWSLSGMGVRSIASRLNREGRPKFGRTGWHHRTVAMLLRNPEVLGFKQPRRLVDGVSVADGTAIADHFPVIINADVFYAVQGAIKSRNVGASGRTGKTLPNLLRGIGRCGCGGALHYIGIPGKSPSRRYLICSNGKRDLCENHTHYLYDRLESELLTILPLFDFSRLLAQTPIDARRGEALAAQITEKSDQLTALARRKISPEIESVMDELTDELKALRIEFVEFTRTARITETETARNQHAEFVKLVASLGGPMSDDDRYLTRSGLANEFRRIIDVVDADSNTLTVKFKPAQHQRVELRLVNQAAIDENSRGFAPIVEMMTVWSRDIGDPSYPDNPLQPVWKLMRNMLLNPDNDLVGLFEQFVAKAA